MGADGGDSLKGGAGRETRGAGPEAESGDAGGVARDSIRIRPRSAQPEARSAVQDVASLVSTCATILQGVEDATGEARDLVTALFEVPRSWALMNASSAVDDLEWKRATTAAAKRAAGMPLQYAVGRAPFRHLTLDVDPRVLIPRPETELLVDIALEAVGGRPGGIAVDVGTGSGAIALALAS